MAAQLISLFSESGVTDCLLACNEDVLTKRQLTKIMTSNGLAITHITVTRISYLPCYNNIILQTISFLRCYNNIIPQNSQRLLFSSPDYTISFTNVTN